jgi:hypothetical protein
VDVNKGMCTSWRLLVSSIGGKMSVQGCDCTDDALQDDAMQ